jgi:ATP synthase subunit 6
MLHAPLEQFQIVSILNLNVLGVDLSITNLLLINTIVLSSFCAIFFLNSTITYHNMQETSFYVLSSTWQKAADFISESAVQLVSDIVSESTNKHIPLIFLLFHFILLNNLVGLLPYSFTTTSHLVITFVLSFTVFVGVNVITFEKYGLKAFSLFLPSNTTFFLALLLVPIELISYLAKPFSLGVRLFVNLMAGHSLMKVVVSFSWGMLLLENLTSLGSIVPLFVLIVLFGLELGVALIQTYVFIILTCIYIQDGS